MSCMCRSFTAWAPVVVLLTFSCGKPRAGSELTQPVGCGSDCDAGELGSDAGELGSDAGQPPGGDAAQPTKGDGGQSNSTGSIASDGGRSSPAPGQRLFGATEALSFNFSLDDAKWQDLQEHGNEEEYVQAALEFESDTL